MNTRWIAVLFASILAAGSARANNAAVSGTRLTGLGGKRAAVTFDIAWENSWRDAINHDACWLFVKYSQDGGASWHHATLAQHGSSAGANTNAEVIVSADGKGAFLQRRNPGEGTLASDDVSLVWNFGADGIPPSPARVRVHAIEMVYVPGGAFYAGDDSSALSFPVSRITSPDMSLKSGTGAGTIADPFVNGAGLGVPKGITGVFSNGYPNGYNAFYVMKHEATRGMYLDFLNSLPYAAATNMLPAWTSVRSQAVLGTHPAYTNLYPWMPAQFTAQVSGGYWYNNAAYLDWAALRPMTEMEFEKACRGPVPPLDQEFPWGTTGKKSMRQGTVVNLNSESETRTNLDDNVHDSISGLLIINGPFRSGAFATAETDLIRAGASYYRILNLADNVNERCVSTGPNARTGTPSTNALAFTGLHGDGEVDASGLANVPGWPANSGAGSSIRGGTANGNAQYGRTADRHFADRVYDYFYYNGIRGARTR